MQYRTDIGQRICAIVAEEKVAGASFAQCRKGDGTAVLGKASSSDDTAAQRL